MIDSGMPPIFVRLIVTWYCEQRACVRWGSTLSPKFNVSNGVRQGGILSPLFFNLYMDRLSVTLSETKVGCALGKTMVNHLAYADDLVILSPSVKGLQKLLNICSEYGEEHDIMFNHTKTECMYFPVKGRALINIPKVFLNAHLLRWVTKYKYLGILLTDDLSDDCNMLRQRGICYARSNSLIRNFSLCSPNVKVKLFKAFCCIMYCCQIWSQYKKDTARKLQVGYNHAFRRIMKYDRTCSASGMFVANGVMSFNELWRKSVYNFKQRVTKSNTFIVNHVYNFTRTTSKIWKNSDHILYIL